MSCGLMVNYGENSSNSNSIQDASAFENNGVRVKNEYDSSSKEASQSMNGYQTGGARVKDNSYNDSGQESDSESESGSGSESDSSSSGNQSNKGSGNEGESSQYKSEKSEEESQRSGDEEDSRIKRSISEDSDEDVPLSKKVKKESEERRSTSSQPNYKDEEESDEDIPLSAKKKKVDKKPSKKRRSNSSDDDSDYGSKKKKSSKSKASATKKKIKKEDSDDDDDYDSDYGEKKKKKTAKKGSKEDSKSSKKSQDSKSKKVKEEQSPTKGKKKKEEDDQHIWKWWEEDNLDTNQKWRTLEHQGPVFAPPYEPLPSNVKLYYDGKPMKLCPAAEEVATFYGKMLDHDYTSKEMFNTNFFKDWKKFMTPEEKKIIVDLKKCDFRQINQYFKDLTEQRKQMTKEEKAEKKKQEEKLLLKFGFCIVDGHKQKIGNYRIEPPGLFRGRGEHPKMGKVKRRIEAEDVIINIGKKAKVPDPPPGHKWKEIRHDKTVSWLASWTENIMGNVKYIMLNPSSKLKSMKDWMKYEKARELAKFVDKIRADYKEDFKAREMVVRQRAVALYFIDRLALRAGNEKEEGETADTVGCCSLRVEHITLDEKKDDKEYVVSFDFLGKDSIRYVNSVPVEKRVFKNLKLFMENKAPGDDLFDRLNTSTLNKYLNTLMEGLTAKVFRTFNASFTLQDQLNKLTNTDMSLPEKILAYNRANREVAVLCNHQRAVPKGHDKQMENLKTKIDEKHRQISDVRKDLKHAKKSRDTKESEKLKKKLRTFEEQLQKLEIQKVDKDENKSIALGTSKLNYLDPRITVAWCKKYDVPIEKVYNKTHRDKFRWAIEMAGPDYVF